MAGPTAQFISEDEKVKGTGVGKGNWRQAAKITPRELEVVRLVCQGFGNSRIAHMLGIHESTVKIHIRNAARSYGARNRAHLAVMVSAEHGAESAA